MTGKGGGYNGIGSTYQKRAPTLLSLLFCMRILLRARDHSLSLGLFPQPLDRENINTHFFVIEGIAPGPQNVLTCTLASPMRQGTRPCFLNTTKALVKLDCQGHLKAEESLIPHPHPRGRGPGEGRGSHPTGSLKGLLSERRTRNFAFHSVLSLDLSK